MKTFLTPLKSTLSSYPTFCFSDFYRIYKHYIFPFLTFLYQGINLDHTHLELILTQFSSNRLLYIVMYGYESCTIKKAEHQRINAFEFWCWRRLLRVPRTARRSNQSILKQINSEYSLGGPRLRLKFKYFGHLMRRADSLEKTLMLGN